MQRFLRYLKGTVTIQVIGGSLQRFMNLCMVKGIELKKVSICDGYAQMEISLRDFWDIRPIVRKTKSKVVILEKKGLPFSMKKWKKRHGFFVGLITCFALIYALSLFVWDIELTGGMQMTKPFLISYLQDEGIGYGVLKNSVDTDVLEKKLREDFPFIVWTNVCLKGTRLIISVKENDREREQTKKDNFPCDLYATAEGTVHSIITRNGIPQVRPGQRISIGDCLVSGQIPIMNDDDTVRMYLYTHADADIYIDTDFNFEKEISYRYEKKEYSEEKSIFYLKLYQRSYVFGTVPDMQQYDVVTDLQQAKLLRDFYLPVYYGKIIYKKYDLKPCKYSKEEMKSQLEAYFTDFCESLSQKGIQIIDKNVTIKDNDKKGQIRARVTVRVKDGDVVKLNVQE